MLDWILTPRPIRRRWLTALFLALLLSWNPFGPNAFAGVPGPGEPISDDQIDKAAAANGADAGLMKRIRRCETPSGGGNSFQITNGKGGPTAESQADWAAKEVAAGRAGRRWVVCSGRGGGGGRGMKRSAPAAPPTGTDHCGRESGTWRCTPSWSLPDALEVTPPATVEVDPGPGIQGCGWTRLEEWRDGRTLHPVWLCSPASVDLSASRNATEATQSPKAP